MESLYKDIFDSPDLLLDQVRGHLFSLLGSEGPTLAVVGMDRQLKTNHPGRIGILMADEGRLVTSLCNRLDDGEDPLVIKVKNGCIAACSLTTEHAQCGYLMIALEGYTPETAGANMPLIEMMLAQAQLTCELVEKNNQLHQSRLVHLSRTSEVLTR